MRIVQVANVEKSIIVGDRIRVADTSATRNVGLLKDRGLASGEGLWIRPCSGVHTFWMKFSIDVIGLDKKRKVVRLWRDLKPFRLTALVFSLGSVIEMASGTIDRLGLELGDSLTITDDSGEVSSR